MCVLHVVCDGYGYDVCVYVCVFWLLGVLLQVFCPSNTVQAFQLAFSILSSGKHSFATVSYAVDLFIDILACNRTHSTLKRCAYVRTLACMQHYVHVHWLHVWMSCVYPSTCVIYIVWIFNFPPNMTAILTWISACLGWWPLSLPLTETLLQR